MKIGVEGYFTITVRRADGSIRKQLKFKNLITNSGMDRIAGAAGAGAAAGQDLWNTLALSTNSTAPSVTDSAMGGTSITTSTSSPVYPNGSVSDGASTYQIRMRAGFKFATGVATGTWSSVGLLFTSTLFCRTLIRAAGVPTSLTITATESLDIQYELRILPTLTDVTGSVTINGTSYSFTGRVYAINDAFAAVRYNKSIGEATYGYYGALLYGPSIALGATTAGGLSSETSPPHTGVTQEFQAGGNRGPDSMTFAAYTSGSYTRNITYVWASTKTAAAGLVNGLWVRVGGVIPPYQFVFSTAIPKGAAEQLSLTFTVTWTRT